MVDTEHRISSIQAYDKRCYACDRYDAHIMLSYTSIDDNTIQDLFLDKEQAEQLYNDLGRSLVG